MPNREHRQSATSRKAKLAGAALPLIAGLGVSIGLCPVASADPLPTEILKFSQIPLLNTNVTPANTIPGVGTFGGHDELSTATLLTPGGIRYGGTFKADDFADRVSSPVVHVSWWGSYLGPQPQTPVPRFLISFETDVPAGTGTPTNSHPGSVLLSQVVSRVPAGPTPPGTFTEAVEPGSASVDGPVFKYNAELAIPFPEQAETVYWIKIVALENPFQGDNFDWGWHNRDYSVLDPLASVPPLVVPGEHVEPGTPGAAYPTPVFHFQDDAVTGGIAADVPGGGINGTVISEDTFAPQNYIGVNTTGVLVDGLPQIGQFSKDLAFQLYYVPEPASLTLVGLAAMGLLVRRNRSNLT